MDEVRYVDELKTYIDDYSPNVIYTLRGKNTDSGEIMPPAHYEVTKTPHFSQLFSHFVLFFVFVFVLFWFCFVLASLISMVIREWMTTELIMVVFGMKFVSAVSPKLKKKLMSCVVLTKSAGFSRRDEISSKKKKKLPQTNSMNNLLSKNSFVSYFLLLTSFPSQPSAC